MSEKFKILELDLGIDKVINKASQSQQAIERLRLEINSLKKSQRDTIKVTEKYKNKLAELQAQGKGSSAQANAYVRFIKKQETATNNTAIQITQMSAAMKNLQKDYNSASRVIQSYTDKKVKELSGYKQTNGSIKQLGASLSLNRQKYENLSKAERENKQIGGELLRLIQKQDKQYKKLKESIGQAQGSVGNYAKALKGVGKYIASTFSVQAIFNFFKTSTDLIRNFELEIATLGGISNATSEELNKLEENALKLGGSTQYTASEVAELQTEFARLGFSTEQIINASEGALNGATALGSGLAETAKLVGATLNSFQKDSTETADVVDVLSKATQTSALDFQQLNTALPIVSATALNAGVSLEQTASYLGVLANNGVDASSSATALRNIFLELSNKGLTWEQAMNKINNATDKNKKANELFGKRGATVSVILATQTKKIAELNKELEKAGGSAKELAEKRMRTLDGALKTLNSKWQAFILNTSKSLSANEKLGSIILFVAKNLTSIIRTIAIATSVWAGYRAGLVATAVKNKILVARQKILALATSGLTVKQKILNTVMKANPIGLITSLLAGLVTWVLSSEKRIKSLTDFVSQLWGTFKDLGSGIIGNIEKSITNAFNNPKKAVVGLWNTIKTNIVNRITSIGGIFKALGKIISSGFTDGYKDLANQTAQVFTGVENVIDKTTDALKKSNDAWVENGKKVEENNEKKRKLKEAEAKLLAEQKKQEELNKLKSGSKNLDKKIKKQQQLLRLYVLQNDKENSSLVEKQNLLKGIYEREKAIIDQKLKAGKITNEEAEIQKIESKNKLLADQTKLALNNAQKELEIYTLNNSKILENEGKLNQDLLTQRKTYLKEKARLQIEALKAEGLSEDEFKAKRFAIEQERDNAIKEDKKTLKEQEKADQLIQEELDFEEKIARLEERNATEFEIQEAKLARDTQLKIDAVNKELITEQQKERKIKLIQQQSAEQQKKIDEGKALAKLEIANKVLGAIGSVLDKESEAGKAVAVAQAIINTAEGVTKALAQGGVVGIATGVAVAAAGALNIQKIMSAKKPKRDTSPISLKASKGITLKGNSHANGGVGLYDAQGNKVVEAEGGENVYAITNKEASGVINKHGILGALSMINQNFGGGIPLAKPVSYARSGGIVQTNLRQSTNVNKVVEAFDDRIDNIRVINVAEDTYNVVSEEIQVQNEANL